MREPQRVNRNARRSDLRGRGRYQKPYDELYERLVIKQEDKDQLRVNFSREQCVMSQFGGICWIAL